MLLRRAASTGFFAGANAATKASREMEVTAIAGVLIIRLGDLCRAADRDSTLNQHDPTNCHPERSEGSVYSRRGMHRSFASLRMTREKRMLWEKRGIYFLPYARELLTPFPSSIVTVCPALMFDTLTT